MTKSPKYRDKDWLYHQYITEKKSFSEIAKDLGCDKSTIGRWARRLKIPLRSPSEIIKLAMNDDDCIYKNKAWLYNQYINQKKSFSEIAKEVGCHYTTIRSWVIRFKIPIRSHSETMEICRNKDNRLYKDRNWLYNQYIIKERSMREIADDFNVDPVNILYWLRKLKIPSRNQKEVGVLERTRQKLREANLGKKLTKEHRRKIGKGLKGHRVKESTKQKIREAHLGREVSEETRRKISLTKQGEKNPFYGKHHTESTKQKIRDAHLGREVSEETREKLSKAHTGKKLSKEHRKNISLATQGENNPNWNPNREEVYAPYGENFYDEKLREEKWKLQSGRDLLTGEKLEEGKEAHYHHIDYDKKNDDPDNHCWLTINNHAKITNAQRRLIKKEYYKKLLQKNTELLKKGKIHKSWRSKHIKLFKQENLVQLRIDNIASIEEDK